MIVAHVKDGYARTDTNRDVKTGDELYAGETIVPIQSVIISINGREDLSLTQGDSLILDKSVISTESIADEATLSFDQLNIITDSLGDNLEISFNENLDFSNIHTDTEQTDQTELDIKLDDLIENTNSDIEILSQSQIEHTQTTSSDICTHNSNSKDLVDILNEEDLSIYYNQG